MAVVQVYLKFQHSHIFAHYGQCNNGTRNESRALAAVSNTCSALTGPLSTTPPVHVVRRMATLCLSVFTIVCAGRVRAPSRGSLHADAWQPDQDQRLQPPRRDEALWQFLWSCLRLPHQPPVDNSLCPAMHTTRAPTAPNAAAGSRVAAHDTELILKGAPISRRTHLANISAVAVATQVIALRRVSSALPS
jgi:hypothetical protein